MTLKEVLVPDIGNFDSVDVIDVLVKVGDTIALDDSLITLETDKASMDIPAPFAGVVKAVNLKVGDKIAQGHVILSLEVAESSSNAEAQPTEKPAPVAEKIAEAPKVVIAEIAIPEPSIPEPSRPAPEPAKQIQPAHQPLPVGESAVINNASNSHASPSVRKFARELGVNLALVKGSAAKNRITEADIQAFVNGELAKPRTENMGAG